MGKIKGVFFTLSTLLIIGLLLTMSLFVALTIKQSNERLIEAGSLERVYILERSIANTITGIDNGILTKVNTQGSTIKINISENSTNQFINYGSTFLNELTTFRNYVELTQPEISINPSQIANGTETLPIIIMPYNSRYTHLNKTGNVSIQLTNQVLIPNYEIYLNLPSETVSSIVWTTQNVGDRNLNASIVVTDKNSAVRKLNATMSSTLLNKFTAGKCTIQFYQLTVEINCDNTYR